MPTSNPCVQCKDKHVKCDGQRPRCQRCEKKGVECSRPSKATVFRHDATSTFSDDQQWVNSRAKKFQFDAHTQASPTHPPQSFLPESFSSPCLSTIPGSSPRLVSEQDGVTTDEEEPLERPMSTPVVSNKMVIGKRRRTTDLTLPDMKIDLNDPLPSVLDPYQLHGQRPLHVNPNDLQEMDLLNQDPGGEWHGIVPYESGDQSLFSVQASPVEPPPATGAATLPHSWGGNQVSDGEANNILLLADTSWASQHDIKHSNSNSTINSTNTDSIPCEPEPTGAKDTVREFPLKDMQEACLLRYYIEEIAHWLDLADESRHFERVVPVLARTQPHLLNAIFAVAARHLFRMPQFKTEDGIRYHSQPLPKLTKHSAVEYMLESIPALRTLEGKGKAYTESVVATAVLLRQLEEIDDDDHDDDDGDYNIPKANFPLPVPAPVPAVNFLNIIDAVLRSEGSQILIGRSELIQASYWMALRQEICYSFTNRKAPQILTAQDLWNGASKVNKAVMHTVQVLKWRYGDSSARTQIEWHRLMDQQEHLEEQVLSEYQSIYRREAIIELGETFPVIWYSSNIEVTSKQQALMARSVLTAEDLAVIENSNSDFKLSKRIAEDTVRLLIKELCGIALCNPNSPPALLHTVFLIRQYGGFFTDVKERHALKKLVERYRDTRAWPFKTLLGMFLE